MLKEIKKIPTKARVCSGTYTTFPHKKKINENTELFICGRFTREVVQVKYYQRKAQKRYAFINLPLTYCCKIGFIQSTGILLTNVKELLMKWKVLPKILHVHQICQCSQHANTEGDLLLVITITECNELLVKNTKSLTIYKLTHACNAIFSTDPEKACVSPEHLRSFPEDSLPWNNVVIKPSLSIIDSPQKNNSACMVIEKFFVEDCFKVQIVGFEDEYVVLQMLN